MAYLLYFHSTLIIFIYSSEFLFFWIQGSWQKAKKIEGDTDSGSEVVGEEANKWLMSAVGIKEHEVGEKD